MEIDINGLKYRQKEQPKSEPMSKTLMTMMVMAKMAGSFGMNNVKQREIPRVSILQEYALIQLKKSNLSKSQRDWVVCQFNKNFELVSS